MEQYPDHDTNLDRIVHSSVLTHEKAGDNFDVIAFDSPVFLTAVTASALPGARKLTEASMNVFARDLRKPSAARFVCLYEGLSLPASGKTMVPVQGIVSDQVVMRGRYQTVPISLHGIPLDDVLTPMVEKDDVDRSIVKDIVGRMSVEEAIGSFSSRWRSRNGPSALDETILMMDSPQISRDIHLDIHEKTSLKEAEVLRKARSASHFDGYLPLLLRLVEVWNGVEALPSRLKRHSLPKETSQEIIDAANAVCDRFEGADPIDFVFDGEACGLGQNPLHSVIDMAMGWSGLLAEVPCPAINSPTLMEYGVTGLAACVLLLCNRECSRAFLSRQGHIVLADVFVHRPRLPKTMIRYALVSCLLLIYSDPCTASNALLGRKDGSSPIAWKDEQSSRECAGLEHPRGNTVYQEGADMEVDVGSGNIPQIDGAGDDEDGERRSRRDRRYLLEEQRRHRDDDKERRRGKDVPREHPSYRGDRERRERHDTDDDKERRRRSESRSRRDMVDSMNRRFSRHDGKSRDRGEESPRSKRDSRRRRSRSQSRGRIKSYNSESRSGTVRSREQDRRRSSKDSTPEDHAYREAKVERRSRGLSSKRDVMEERTDKSNLYKEKKYERKRNRSASRSSSPSSRKRMVKGSKSHASSLPPPLVEDDGISDERKDTVSRFGKSHAEDIEYIKSSSIYWDEKLASYRGVYGVIASFITHEVWSRGMTCMAAKILKILRLYNFAIEFSIATENIARDVINARHGTSERTPTMDSQYVAEMAPRLCAALLGIAADLGDRRTYEKLSDGMNKKIRNEGSQAVSEHLGEPLETNSVLLPLLSDAGLVELLPVALHLPSALVEVVHPSSGKMLSSLAANIHSSLKKGVGSLLAAITSTASGVQYLRSRSHETLEDIVSALKSAGSGFEHMSKALDTIIVSSSALDTLMRTSSMTPETCKAARSLLSDLRSSDSSRRVSAVHIINMRVHEVFPTFIRFVDLQRQFLLQAAGVHSELFSSNVQEFTDVMESLPYLDIGADSLHGLVSELRHASLPVRWSKAARDMAIEVSKQASLLYGCPSPGATALFSKLERIRGGFEAVGAMHDTGIEELLKLLEGDLPSQRIDAAVSGEINFTAPGASEYYAQEHTSSKELHELDSSVETSGDGKFQPSDLSNNDENQRLSWQSIKFFWDDSSRRGRTLASLRLIANVFSNRYDYKGRDLALLFHSMDALRIFRRSLVSATRIFEAAQCDRLWMSRTGASMDYATSSSNKLAAAELLFSAAEALSLYLEHLKGVTEIDDRACLAALIEAHAVLSKDESSLLIMLGKKEKLFESDDKSGEHGSTYDVPKQLRKRLDPEGAMSGLSKLGSLVLSSRHFITIAMKCWIEKKNWTPHPLAGVIVGSQYLLDHSCHQDPWSGTDGISPLRSLSRMMDMTPGPASLHASGFVAPPIFPSQAFSAMSVIGDLCPEEWPPVGRRTKSTATDSSRKLVLPPPTDRPWRLALAHSFEGCQKLFEHLLKMSFASDSSILRALTVRVLSRAAGLGGGMGPFLIAPIVSGLHAVTSSTSPCDEARPLLELLVPLVYRPAIKAALLETEAASHLSTILGRVAAAPASAVPPTIDPREASLIVTMLLEVLTALCNPDIALDPATSPEFEVPSPSQGASIASALLEHISILESNAQLAHRVLRLMTSTARGRAGLRFGAVKLHCASFGQEAPKDPGRKPILAAAQWVATKFWQASSVSKKQGSPFSAIGADIADIMKEICTSMDNDDVEIGRKVVPPAAVRFASAAKAAVAAAPEGSAKGCTLLNAMIDAARDEDLVHEIIKYEFDPSMRMFWKNLQARAVPRAQASRAVARRYKMHVCMDNESATITSMLPPYLTVPTRPLSEDMHSHMQEYELLPEPEGQDGGQSEAGLLSTMADESKPGAQDEGALNLGELDIHQTYGEFPPSNTVETSDGVVIRVEEHEHEYPSEGIHSMQHVGDEGTGSIDIDIYADLAGNEMLPSEKPAAEDVSKLISSRNDDAGFVEASPERNAEPVLEDVAERVFLSEEDIQRKESDPRHHEIDAEGKELPEVEAKICLDEHGSGASEEMPLVGQNDAATSGKGAETELLSEEVPEDKQEGGNRELKGQTITHDVPSVAGATSDQLDMMALLSDPVKLAQMLKSNPALRTAIKEKLSGKR